MIINIPYIDVYFIGGPLAGQSRKAVRGQTHYETTILPKTQPYSLAEEIPECLTLPVIYYKIERRWENKPDTIGFREWFEGVLE